MPKSIGESRRILESPIKLSLCALNPGNILERIVGNKKYTTALAAIIRSKKILKTLSRNFLTNTSPFFSSSTKKGMITDIETSEPIVIKRKSGILNAA